MQNPLIYEPLLRGSFLEYKSTTSWQIVWAIIDGGQLSLSIKRQDPVPFLVIDLKVTKILEEPETPTYKKFCFELVVEQDKETKKYLFCGKVQRTKERWIRSLVQHQKGEIEEDVEEVEEVQLREHPFIQRRTMSVMIQPTKIPHINGNPKQIVHSSSLPVVPLDKSKTMSLRITKMPPSPVIPHMDAKTLYDLVNPKKPKKKILSRKAIQSVTIRGNPAEAYAESVEAQVIDNWLNKDPDVLAVWADFPRVVRHIQTFDEKLNIIQLPSTLKEEEILGSSDEEQEERMRKNMREVLILFAYRLAEKKELIEIEKYFLNSLGPEPAIHLKKFFEIYIAKNSRLLSILKALNQAILAAPYISLRNKFTALDLPIVDISGSWLIETVFKTEEIVIIHSKKAKSTSESAEEDFSFRWHIALVFDRALTTIKEVRLSMTDLELNKVIKDKIKKKLQSIKEHELFL